MNTAATFLAEEESSGSGSAIFWLLVIFVLVFIGFVLVTFVRRSLAADDFSKAEGFTLGDLRRLHKAGKMTDEEFQRAKTALIAGLKGPPPTPGAEMKYDEE